MNKQISKIEITLEGPVRSKEFINKVILREIGDIFYSVAITKHEIEIVKDE